VQDPIDYYNIVIRNHCLSGLNEKNHANAYLRRED